VALRAGPRFDRGAHRSAPRRCEFPDPHAPHLTSPHSTSPPRTPRAHIRWAPGCGPRCRG
jgi:hypothetical protein